eukprot:g63224.t1
MSQAWPSSPPFSAGDHAGVTLGYTSLTKRGQWTHPPHKNTPCVDWVQTDLKVHGHTHAASNTIKIQFAQTDVAGDTGKLL